MSKVIKKYTESMKSIEEVVLTKLLVDEPSFTGKILVEINCNQGGITGVEVFTKRKLD